MVKRVLIVFVAFLFVQSLFAQRMSIDFNKDWKFYLGNDSLASAKDYNDTKWRNLNLPHDWSIESDFIKEAPATNQGGSLPGGIGWYRKTFTLPPSSREKIVSIEFDGVYKNSEVWINGTYLGKRPYGYVNFSYNLTPFLDFDGLNVIAVKVDNSQQPDSRWYTGSGIYRDVKLVMKNKISFQENGIYITTEQNNNECKINIQSIIEAKQLNAEMYKINYVVTDASGKVIPDNNFHTAVMNSLQGNITKDLFTYSFKKPILWSPSNPYLYKLKASLYVEGSLMDEIAIPFGIRHFNFDSEKGFSLNGKPLKLFGVCMHHDLGALGAAFNKEAARRQLKILKEMGCNAIRCSHNPPASEFLDLCDEMGFLVIDEAFDMWAKRKNKFDYHLYFKEWYQKDIEAMVLRDRNHPSVFMWSIGNEIREQFDSTGTTITKELTAIVKNLDPTRPVICALTETMPEKNYISQSNALDVLGFNYKDYDYKELPKRFPGQKFLATETASALETRGVYQFPADSIRIWPPNFKVQDTFSGGNKDYTSAAYDNTHAYWGNTHEKSWLAVKNNPHIAGAFVWSGFDYLGEPMPYPNYPSRSSYYGIIDLAGFPKDVYYMYQSEWSKKNVLHVFPHWSWNKGDMVDVWAYYNNADEVELYLNGKSLGVRKKNDTSLHVLWRVPFTPGTLKAVSRKNGKTVLTKEVKTANQPARIDLSVDKRIMKADGSDLIFVTAKIVDRNGILVPDANNLLEFSVTGAGIVAGTDNGYQADTVSLKNNKRNCWKGMALAIIQSSGKKGNITLKVSGKGLASSVITLKATD
jgi:beta-galactosidase